MCFFQHRTQMSRGVGLWCGCPTTCWNPAKGWIGDSWNLQERPRFQQILACATGSRSIRLLMERNLAAKWGHDTCLNREKLFQFIQHHSKSLNISWIYPVFLWSTKCPPIGKARQILHTYIISYIVRWHIYIYNMHNIRLFYYTMLMLFVFWRRHMWRSLLTRYLQNPNTWFPFLKHFWMDRWTLSSKIACNSVIMKMNPLHFPHKAPSTKHSNSGSWHTEADMMLDCSSDEGFLLIVLWHMMLLWAWKKKWKKHSITIHFHFADHQPTPLLEMSSRQFYLSWMPWVAAVQRCLQLSLWNRINCISQCQPDHVWCVADLESIGLRSIISIAKCHRVPVVQRRTIEFMEDNSSKGHGQVTLWMKAITSGKSSVSPMQLEIFTKSRFKNLQWASLQAREP